MLFREVINVYCENHTKLPQAERERESTRVHGCVCVCGGGRGDKTQFSKLEQVEYRVDTGL
jgi:hypothetical protein